MEAELTFNLFALLLAIAVFSILLGIWATQRGYRYSELQELCEKFDERRATKLGKLVHCPDLMRNTTDHPQQFLRFVAPAVINGFALGWIYGQGYIVFLPVLTPLVIIIGALEWGAIAYLQKQRRSSYQMNFDRYMEMTAPGNKAVVALLKACDCTLTRRVPSTGRLLMAIMKPATGSELRLRLFCPNTVDLDDAFRGTDHENGVPVSCPVDVFYEPAKEVEREWVDGILKGVQRRHSQRPVEQREAWEGSLHSSYN